MASQTKITITHDKETTAELKQAYIPRASQAKLAAILIENLMNALKGGSRNASMDLTIDDGDAVAASGTVSFSGVGSANDTLLINGVTFTAVASGATGNQWNVGASATATAANVAAAIVASASALVNQHVTATSALGVLTVTSISKSALGNAVTLAKGVDAGTVMTVSGARLTGGTNSANGATNTYKFGL